MSVVKCPTNMTAITMVTSGALVPDAAGNITVTVAEATAMCAFSFKPKIHSTNASGNTKGWFPGLGGIITDFTVNAVTLTIGSDDVTTAYTASHRLTPVVNQGFILVQG